MHFLPALTTASTHSQSSPSFLPVTAAVALRIRVRIHGWFRLGAPGSIAVPPLEVSSTNSAGAVLAAASARKRLTLLASAEGIPDHGLTISTRFLRSPIVLRLISRRIPTPTLAFTFTASTAKADGRAAGAAQAKLLHPWLASSTGPTIGCRPASSMV